MRLKKIKGSRWAIRGSLNHVVNVKAGRLWSDGDLDERLKFKMPRLGKASFKKKIKVMEFSIRGGRG